MEGIACITDARMEEGRELSVPSHSLVCEQLCLSALEEQRMGQGLGRKREIICMDESDYLIKIPYVGEGHLFLFNIKDKGYRSSIQIVFLQLLSQTYLEGKKK